MNAEAVGMTSSFDADPVMSGCRPSAKPGVARISSMPLKSPEMAQKVVEAQSNDQVHLLICKAVFAFQCARGPAYHCHLERPVGSEMLNQEVMQFVVSNTLRARCDFCKAGMLKRPQTQMPMQKGTQVLTTSIIMQRYLDSQRCPRHHEHTPVAGNYRDRMVLGAHFPSLSISTYMWSQGFQDHSSQQTGSGNINSLLRMPVFKVSRAPGYPEPQDVKGLHEDSSVKDTPEICPTSDEGVKGSLESCSPCWHAEIGNWRSF